MLGKCTQDLNKHRALKCTHMQTRFSIRFCRSVSLNFVPFFQHFPRHLHSSRCLHFIAYTHCINRPSVSVAAVADLMVASPAASTHIDWFLKIHKKWMLDNEERYHHIMCLLALSRKKKKKILQTNAHTPSRHREGSKKKTHHTRVRGRERESEKMISSYGF